MKSTATITAGPGIVPGAVETFDLRGIGKHDLVLPNVGSANITVLLANGDGTYRGPVNYAVVLVTLAVTAADFTGNGRLDLAQALIARNLSVPRAERRWDEVEQLLVEADRQQPDAVAIPIMQAQVLVGRDPDKIPPDFHNDPPPPELRELPELPELV